MKFRIIQNNGNKRYYVQRQVVYFCFIKTWETIAEYTRRSGYKYYESFESLALAEAYLKNKIDAYINQRNCQNITVIKEKEIE